MIYLDNSATTRPAPQVVAQIQQILSNGWGNPSSAHGRGFQAARILAAARSSVAELLSCPPECITFTGSGTESDNLALFGTAEALARRGRHIITTAGEHPAVLRSCERLQALGFEVTYLPLDKTGQIRLSDLDSALRPDTILVSIMLVNNELGTIYPVKEAAALTKQKSPLALFHTDAVQALGKIPVAPSRLGVDLLSVSAHKIHGPQGVGALYIAPKVRLIPRIFGGGQEKGLRSGTENLPGIAGFGAAAEFVKALPAGHYEALKKELLAALPPDVLVNSPADGAPHIVSISIPGLKSEVALRALSDHGVYVSAGSACSSKKNALSPVLLACGLEKERIDTTLRISFGAFNTPDDCREFVKILAQVTHEFGQRK